MCIAGRATVRKRHGDCNSRRAPAYQRIATGGDAAATTGCSASAGAGVFALPDTGSTASTTSTAIAAARSRKCALGSMPKSNAPSVPGLTTTRDACGTSQCRLSVASTPVANAHKARGACDIRVVPRSGGAERARRNESTGCGGEDTCPPGDSGGPLAMRWPPRAVKASPRAVKASPLLVEPSPRAMEVRPRAMEARPRAMEARPRAMEARPRAMEVRPRAMEARPRAMEARPRAMEVRPRAMEAPPRAVERRPRAVGPRSSVPRGGSTASSAPSTRACRWRCGAGVEPSQEAPCRGRSRQRLRTRRGHCSRRS
jgi:hypothetical protein